MGHEGALSARWPRRLQPAEHHPRASRARSTSSTAGTHRSPRQGAPGLHWGSDHTGTEPACLRTAPGLSPNLANLPRHPGSSQVQKRAPQAVGVAAAPPGQCLGWLSPAHHTWSTACRLASRAAGNPEHRQHASNQPRAGFCGNCFDNAQERGRRATHGLPAGLRGSPSVTSSPACTAVGCPHIKSTWLIPLGEENLFFLICFNLIPGSDPFLDRH